LTAIHRPASVSSSPRTCALFSPISVDVDSRLARVTQLLDGLTSDSWYTEKPTHEQFAQYMSSWTDLRAHVDRIAAPDTAVAYWQQLLKSTGEYAMLMFAYDEADSMNTSAAALVTTRDVQMGDNLLWLARKKYPDRKIIVWAATFHIMRNPELVNTGTRNPMNYKDVTPMGYKNVITMGHVVSDTRDEVYSIGFIASEGRVGWMFHLADSRSAARKFEAMLAYDTRQRIHRPPGDIG
jgi:erythromycin esterase-like protein